MRLPAQADVEEVYALICRIYDARQRRPRYADVLDVMLGDHPATREVLRVLELTGRIKVYDNGVLVPVRPRRDHWRRYVPGAHTDE
jgi:hypothetical protein